MALVNTPPITPPRKWLEDPELGKHVQELYMVVWQLFQRSGGGTDAIELDGAQIETNTNNITNINADLSNLVLDYIAKSVDYTASAGDFVAASNGITVTMPLEPNDNDALTVFNSDASKITINGNGKDIDDTATKISVRKNTSLSMVFYTDGDAWVIS